MRNTGLHVAQNFPDDSGIRIKGVRITEGPL
jgi:hypothetical protein